MCVGFNHWPRNQQCIAAGNQIMSFFLTVYCPDIIQHCGYAFQSFEYVHRMKKSVQELGNLKKRRKTVFFT